MKKYSWLIADQEKAHSTITKLSQEGVHFILLTFCDVMGNLKEVTIPIDQAKKVFDQGITVATFSLTGCTSVTESDVIIKPDLSTLRYVPWSEDAHKTAWFMCSILKNDTDPYEADPRFILQRELKLLEANGYTFNVGAELEFFLFKLDSDGKPVLQTEDTKKYFDPEHSLTRQQEKQRIINALKDLGIIVEKLHREGAPGQHEISIKYDNALAIADQLIVAKHALKMLAHKLGFYASFMPKPLESVSGNGLHFHFSLKDIQNQENIFYSADDEYNLSAKARAFIAGILDHAQEITCFFNPSINSYKRLAAGLEAPVYVCWGITNRTALIRIPAVNSTPDTMRAEMRAPDSLCNPYLTLAALLKSGLRGIAQNKKLPKHVEANLFLESKENIAASAIETLPTSLCRALDLLEKSSIAQELLGKIALEQFLQVKRKECAEYATTITEWEIKRYL